MNTASLYVTVSDVINRYPPVQSVSAVTSAQVAEAIAYEQSVVDARLGARYAVPFAAPPAIVQTIVGDMAIYRLLTTRVLLKEQREGEWTNAWTRTMRLLDDIANGSLTLLSDSGTVLGLSARAAGELWSNSATSTPVFVGQPFELVRPSAGRREGG